MTNKTPASEDIEILLTKDWAQQHSDNPCFASQSGNHEFDDQLQDISSEAFDRRLKHNKQLLKSLDEFVNTSFGSKKSKDTVCGMNSADIQMLRQSISDETRALELGCHLFPLNSIGYGGVHYNFLEALDWLGSSDSLKRDQNLVSRMKAFPKQCQQFKDLLSIGIKKKRIASKSMLWKVPEQLRASIRPKQLVNMVAGITDSDLKVEADKALKAFSVAIEDLVNFVETSYLPHARPQSGCCGMADGIGAEVYALCLRFHTTTTMTPEEVYATGLVEVERIERRYQKDVLQPLGFKGSFSEFVTSCHDPAKGHFFTDQNALLDGYRSLCADIQKVLPKYFEKFPSSPLEIVSKDMATAPAAYYMQGTADGTRPGRFYVNVSNLDKRPKYEMTSLALHEAIPGHHHQNALAIENPNIPAFRRFIEDRRYEYCPARRQLYCAYLEGWALYCEHLGEEMGMYKTPYDLFGRLSMEMMRAVRLVVDTGIHSKGWDIEKATKYMMEKTGMHRHECEPECYRYEAWPGQACAYYVGYVAIRNMRARAEKVLSDTGIPGMWDLRQFHSVLLDSGPMTLDVLDEIVDAWIQTKLNKCNARGVSN